MFESVRCSSCAAFQISSFSAASIRTVMYSLFEAIASPGGNGKSNHGRDISLLGIQRKGKMKGPEPVGSGPCAASLLRSLFQAQRLHRTVLTVPPSSRTRTASGDL